MEVVGAIIIRAFFAFLPAYIGNMMPVIVYKIPVFKRLFNARIDCGLNLNHQPLFGEGKTWMGLFCGFVGGIIGGYFLFLYLSITRQINSSESDIILVMDLLYGGIIGFGALIGDLVKSFFKRRLGIASGKPWIIFDQIDLIVGAYIFSFLIYPIPITYFLIALVITPPLHLGTNYLAYKLKLKKVWW